MTILLIYLLCFLVNMIQQNVQKKETIKNIVS